MAPKKGGGNKTGASKKQLPSTTDQDHIVFEDDKKKRKGKTVGPSEEGSAGPTKPTARQVVGGASWTGKLPVNLLSELCQRQKWNKPDYSMRQMPAKAGSEKVYRSDVTLSRTDPRTRQTTTLPPIRLPQTDAQLADEMSALEARHFAATYALFRLQSMKNIHMMLPPKYRDLWKGEFSRIKKQDIEAGQGWRYEEDPFAAEEKRQEILKSIEKRKDEDKKRHEAEARLQEEGIGGVLPVRSSQDNRAWEHAPHVAMGQQIRLDVEEVIRHSSTWNQYGYELSGQQHDQVVADVTKLGFRKSHVQEALEYCQDYQEVLEWLLVHLPEDDLPQWTFPSNYNAGVTLASGDLEKERKLKRLTSAGYPLHLCAQTLRSYDGDEILAAFSLQQILVPIPKDSKGITPNSAPVWKEETSALEAIFGDKFLRNGDLQCSITMSTSHEQQFTAHFKCPMNGYPQTSVPAISIEVANTAAYIRLSATKQAIEYAQSELMGEVMMYSICQWLEMELPHIIEDPGRLSDLRIIPSGNQNIDTNFQNGKGKTRTRTSKRHVSTRASKNDRRSDTDILDQWKVRQATADQVNMIEIRKRLPAWVKQQEIINAVQNQQITIISGETGSGKSTQVVQFILDNAIQSLRGARTSIICTQPRRVAALSLADRVSSERCCAVGDEVGYSIRGESKMSEQTKITFMTTGVLLRRLQSYVSTKDALAEMSHIFIDEVHERSLDTDFLLALLKESIAVRPQLKIVLMSATLDAQIFSDYFGGPSKVALVNIEGRTFPVHDLYLEDVISRCHTGLGEVEVGKAIQGLGFGINYDLIRDTILHIDYELGEKPGSILVFLPGTMEIERCLKSINSSKILGLPLHASLLPAEQRKVFPSAPQGQRKVIAATNVAETSITIEDVVAVIDTGKVKETRYDAVNNIVRLEEVWASHAACKQRRGRAGRVRAGTCYKLFTQHTEAKMPAKTLPEIQRVPLEQLCLSVKATNSERDIEDFLSRTLTPPDSAAVANAIKTLHTMNALDNGQLTALGTYLSLIPADLRCAKMLVYGAIFDCLEPCLTIASILTTKSPFVNPRTAREEANEARMKFPNSDGDLLLDMTAYEEWNAVSSNLKHRDLVEWCSSRFLSNQVLRDISSTRRQLLDSLKDAGLVPFNYRTSARSEFVLKDNNQIDLLTAVIAASLQPQIAVISFPSKKYIASMTGAKELDPEAKTIKFFIPDDDPIVSSQTATPVDSRPGTPRPNISDSSGSRTATSGERTPHLSRVFVHPASCLFAAQTFPRHSTHLSYFTKMMTTKPFIRDLTPLNVYSLLLFGGKLELDTSGRGLVVGGVWKVKGWARIGVLISRLRVLLDEELGRTVEGGGVLLGMMAGSKLIQLIKRLLVLNGQDR